MTYLDLLAMLAFAAPLPLLAMGITVILPVRRFVVEPAARDYVDGATLIILAMAIRVAYWSAAGIMAVAFGVRLLPAWPSPAAMLPDITINTMALCGIYILLRGAWRAIPERDRSRWPWKSPLLVAFHPDWGFLGRTSRRISRMLRHTGNGRRRQ